MYSLIISTRASCVVAAYESQGKRSRSECKVTDVSIIHLTTALSLFGTIQPMCFFQ